MVVFSPRLVGGWVGWVGGTGTFLGCIFLSCDVFCFTLWLVFGLAPKFSVLLLVICRFGWGWF